MLAHYVELSNQRAADLGPINGEIVAGCSARWHIALVEPGHERIAAAHLVARRFGVYLPMWERKVTQRGRRGIQQFPLFPTYLFVFAWDVDSHRRRILACPGVRRIMCDIDGRTVSVPDALIDRIREAENVARLPLTMTVENIRRRRRRRGEKGDKEHIVVREQREVPIDPDEIVGVTAGSYPMRTELADIDSGRRLGALSKALGLAL